MKAWMVGLLITVLATNLYAKEAYRTFTDAKGRSITAKITDCNPSKNKVTLELKGNTRNATIPISSLAEADQAYIKEWFIINEALSPSKLRISCDEVCIKEWEKTETEDLDTSNGQTYEDVFEYVTQYEQIAYSIALQNNGATPLENLRIEYKIYYEQSESTQKKIDPKDYVSEGTIAVEPIKSKKKAALQTEAVQIKNTDININGNFSFDYPPVGAKGKTIGMRAHIYMKLPSGKEAMREFSIPESLSAERYPWEEEEE